MMIKKHLAAFTAATLMTACSGAAILAIGGVALFNQAGVTPANKPSQAAKTADVSLASQSQVQQLQAEVAQYQARDQQYQAREQQLTQALNQAQASVQAQQQQTQQVQMLLLALQQRGLISITNDGRILINR
jgi:hypothetical protein